MNNDFEKAVKEAIYEYESIRHLNADYEETFLELEECLLHGPDEWSEKYHLPWSRVFANTSVLLKMYKEAA